MSNQHREFNPADSVSAAAEIETDLVRIVHGLTEAQFHAPSPSGGWSVGFCIEHLVLTGHAFLSIWDRALRRPETSYCPGNGSSSYPWWNRLMLIALEPPYAMKTRTIQPLVPSSRRSIEETIRRFTDMHRELVRRIELSTHVDARRTKVRSPFASWIQYPLGFSFDFALTHERRHLWQARQVRRQFVEGDP